MERDKQKSSEPSHYISFYYVATFLLNRKWKRHISSVKEPMIIPNEKKCSMEV